MSSPSPDSCLPTPEPTSDDEVLVRVENVSKKFCRNLKKSLWYGVKDIARELLPLPGKSLSSGTPSEATLRPGEFWANQGISFELRRGQCLGLIGHNGAGKTTLLKMLNGLIKPDVGCIEMKGRVGALIALGAGFNPILTGRENVYVNGAVLGLTKKEIDDKFDDIVDFAEIDDFIDSPVQTYSSGMQVRLGFAVATAMGPDILLLDEVLAVGDAAFRQKCVRRVKSFLDADGVGLFVSHNMNQVFSLCTDVLYLEKGKKTYFGPTAEGMQFYQSSGIALARVSREETTPIDNAVRISQISVANQDAVNTHGDVEFVMHVEAEFDMESIGIGFSVWTQDDQVRLFTIRNDLSVPSFHLRKGMNHFRAKMSLPLCPGAYCLKGMVFDAVTSIPHFRIGFEESPMQFVVRGDPDDQYLLKQAIHGEIVAIPSQNIIWSQNQL